MTSQLFEISPSSPTQKNSEGSISRNTSDVIAGISRYVPPSSMNLLVLSYRTIPDGWLHNWQRQLETLPKEVGFIRIGETTRSATGSTERRESPSLVEALPDSADVTQLKSSIRAYIDEWADNGHQTVIYLDSLLPLVRSVGLNTAYSFLHTLAGRIRSVSGYGYYHVQPSAENREITDLLFDLADDHIGLTNSMPSRRSAHE